MKLSEMSFEKKALFAFLVLHFVVWTGISLIRTVLPTDSLEGIYWGSFWDWGTPKHPPLSGWLTYIAYGVVKKDIMVYLLSQAFIIGGFIYIYKLAKYFLNQSQAILSVILLEGLWCYSYITGYYGFNPDVILMLTLPAITYYFYNTMKTDKPSDWLKLGIFTGISLLGKYQTAFFVIPMFIWALMFKREVFKDAKFYLTALLAIAINIPHLLWLIKYDFYPFLYYEGQLSSHSFISYLLNPIIFVVMQIAMASGCLLIYGILRLKKKTPLKFVETENKKDLLFLLLFGCLPLAFMILIGFFTGGRMYPRWGYVYLFLTTIMLFYLFPVETDEKDFKFVLKTTGVIMSITFIAFSTLLAVEKNYRSRYPVTQIYEDMSKVWSEQINTPLKYVGGYIEFSMPLTIYAPTHPDNLLDTYKYQNPWINADDLKKSGALLIDRRPEGVIYWAKQTVLHLPESYEFNPIPYNFTVKNALGQPREYTVYYLIIPPMK